MLDALLLDLDGTILDTHDLLFRCYDHAVREVCGREGSRPVWETYLGLPLRQVFVVTFDQYGRQADEATLQAASRCYRAFQRDNEATVQTYPGVRETLTELRRRGVRLAVVTTKFSETATRQLGAFGLAGFFEALVTGDQCVNCKPDAEPFLRALTALDVGADRAAGVGDSVHDVNGSRAAGLLSVAACWGTMDRNALLAAGPDRIAEAPKDLLELLS